MFLLCDFLLWIFLNMETLKVTGSPLLLIFANCLECMVCLVTNVRQEIVQVMETKCLILKALDQGSAEPYFDQLTVNKLKDDDEKCFIETMIVQACDTLSYCVVPSSINFSPHFGKVNTMFTRLLGCSSFQIRRASILGLPNLLLSLKVADKNIDIKRCLTFFIVRSLIEALKKETDMDLYTTLLRSLAKCIQHAARAIGICAMYGGDQFKASGVEGILRLYNVMRKRISISDTAVAALGKICEFHRDSISPKVVQKWLNFLPLKHDFSEARYAHGLLSKLIQSSDEQLFGSNNQNLCKIISVVKEILSGDLAVWELRKQLIR